MSLHPATGHGRPARHHAASKNAHGEVASHPGRPVFKGEILVAAEIDQGADMGVVIGVMQRHAVNSDIGSQSHWNRLLPTCALHEGDNFILAANEAHIDGGHRVC